MNREFLIVGGVVIAFYQFRFTKHPFLVSAENISDRGNSRRQGNRARLLRSNRAPNKNEESNQADG
jgi:hypothetical protein